MSTIPTTALSADPIITPELGRIQQGAGQRQAADEQGHGETDLY
jgi:hypothetical protein